MNTNKSLRKVTVCGLFAAMMAVFSLISIPSPSGVPLTLQIFAAALCGYMLGVKRGICALSAYIALGAVGMPVFSGFRGGVWHILGPTGGFLSGFIILAAVCGAASGKGIAAKLLFGFCGTVICHAVGAVQFSIVCKTLLFEAIVAASLPYIVKDAILILAAALTASKIKVRVARH